MTLDFNDDDEQTIEHKRIDTDDLRYQLLSCLYDVLSYLFPVGEVRGNQFVIGNIKGDKGDSLSITLTGAKAGLWHDFATGEGGDIFALWAACHGLDDKQDFIEVTDSITQWLGYTHQSKPIIQNRSAKKTSIDELGAYDHKWDYHDVKGNLLACVYRYDTTSGKQFRPWDAIARKMQVPNPRPLYNQLGMLDESTVVLVEGEKCADALINIGICATTAMMGANAPIDKTDWSPLQNKHLLIWPDNDEAGKNYSHKVSTHLTQHGITASVTLLSIPEDKPDKWDAADAIVDGLDVRDFIASCSKTEQMPQACFDLSQWRAVDRFAGKPQKRKWLVDGVFPMAQTSLIAASGGVGKSFLLLSLAREAAISESCQLNAPMLFGGTLVERGTSVYITAEDDAIEVHNRLHALGNIPDRLYVMPLPDAGGAMALFAPDPASRKPITTDAWSDLTSQVRKLDNLKLVVLDPLQPLCALDLNIPENAQFVCSRLAALATSTGASLIVSHHFAKREASSPEQAREAIRGTGGLVDGVRSVYALWTPKEEQAKGVCKALDIPFQRGQVVNGGVVKANGAARLHISTFIRDERGLLVDQTDFLRDGKHQDYVLIEELKSAVARAAVEGKPYTKTGGNGVYERRHELPEGFHSIGKHKIAEWLGILLDAGGLVMAMAQGSKVVKWLDVPDGPVATGDADFVVGHLERSKSGMGMKL